MESKSSHFVPPLYQLLLLHLVSLGSNNLSDFMSHPQKCKLLSSLFLYSWCLEHGIIWWNSNKMKVKVKSLSRVWLFATPWMVAYQAPWSMGFSRQEHWRGLPFPSPGDLPNPGIEPGSLALEADALQSEPLEKPSYRLNAHVNWFDVARR